MTHVIVYVDPRTYSLALVRFAILGLLGLEDLAISCSANFCVGQFSWLPFRGSFAAFHKACKNIEIVICFSKLYQTDDIVNFLGGS